MNVATVDYVNEVRVIVRETKVELENLRDLIKTVEDPNVYKKTKEEIKTLEARKEHFGTRLSVLLPQRIHEELHGNKNALGLRLVQ